MRWCVMQGLGFGNHTLSPKEASPNPNLHDKLRFHRKGVSTLF